MKKRIITTILSISIIVSETLCLSVPVFAEPNDEIIVEATDEIIDETIDPDPVNKIDPSELVHPVSTISLSEYETIAKNDIASESPAEVDNSENPELVGTDNEFLEDELVSSYMIGTVDSAFAAGVQKALWMTDKNMSDYDKALALHDYIVSHVSYDTNFRNYSARTALVDGKTVCNGYSSAYQYLASMIGLSTDLAESTGMNHQWNIVKVNGSWYQVDTTWDDPLWGVTETEMAPGTADKSNFLVSDATLESELDHYGWRTSQKCTSTAYENYFYRANSFESPVFKVDGQYIYNKNGSLYKTSGGTSTGGLLSTSTSQATGKPTFFYKQGKFYYNDDYHLYKYDYKRGTRSTIYTSSKSIFGVEELDNGFNVTVYLGSSKFNTTFVPTSAEYSNDIPLQSISIAASTTSLRKGQSAVFSCIETPWYTTVNKNVKWTSSNPNIVTIDNNGFVEVTGYGKATITAQVGSLTDSVEINVTNPVTYLSVTPYTTNVGVGKTKQLSISYYPMDTSDLSSLKWVSSNTAVATVDQNGLVTGVSEGSTVINVTMGSKTATTTVNVLNKPITSLSLNYSNFSLRKGSTRQLTAYYSPYDTTDDTTALWSSSNSAVASVDENGLVTMKTAGKAVITVKMGNKSAVCNVEVTVPYSDKVENKYTDVSADKWYTPYVQAAYDNGIMNGYSGTSRFGTNDPLTREQFATMIYRMEKTPAVTYTGKFSDVPNGKYYSEAVEWCASVGIVNGYSNSNRFGTGDKIKREQLATMLFRYAQYKGKDTSNRMSLDSFPDKGQAGDYAVEALEYCAGSGIVTGKNKSGVSYLDPKASATRAECAAMVVRFQN